MGEETGDVVSKGLVQYRTWRFILSAQYSLSISVFQGALSFIREMEIVIITPMITSMVSDCLFTFGLMPSRS